jgi:murein DD-endopeptidase MepM/ murein hydrolase activator NlpD
MPLHVLPFPESKVPAGGDFGNKEAPRTNPHRGVDFAVAGGTPIKSATVGKVVVSKWNTVLGNVVVVEDHKGVFWGYCHLRDVGAPIGTECVAGVTVIGKVGNTGTASRGAHLHFTCSPEMDGYSQGKVVDPLAGLKKRIAAEVGVKPVEVSKAPAKPPMAAERVAEETVDLPVKPAPKPVAKRVPKTAEKAVE